MPEKEATKQYDFIVIGRTPPPSSSAASSSSSLSPSS
jgi:hypothetical protein